MSGPRVLCENGIESLGRFLIHSDNSKLTFLGGPVV